MTQKLDGEFNEYLDLQHVPLVASFLEGKSKPSEVLKTLDPDAYEQQRDQWIEQRLNEALGCGHSFYELNRSRFDALSEIACKGRVVPFVGAGLSCGLGLPSWRSFLLDLSKEKVGPSDKIECLLDRGEYESAATTLAECVGAPLFQEYFDRKFRVGEVTRADPAIEALLQLVSGAIVTTNYDQVLETMSGKSFSVFNRMQPGQFLRLAREGQRVLLKVHGDLKIPESIVLLARDYERAYGTGGKIDLKRPLCQVLRVLFLSHTVLFVGCRLAVDRTMILLKAIAADHVWGSAHYAVVEAPEERIRRTQERFLAERRVFPIWYGKGEYRHVTVLLEELLRRKAET